tara:strand:- start:101 stop:619 length:519 start_codon:yes stop_codon:yes gene_type:complete
MKDYIYTIGAVLPMLIITWYCSSLLDERWEEYRILQEQLWECQDDGIGDGTFRTHVTLTMYHPTRGQTDSTPNITADGTKINIWKASDYRYVAVSRDLLSRWGGPLDYGDWIVIEGAGKNSGVYQIRDTMNPKWTKRVDILKTPGTKQFKYTDNITLTRYGSRSEAIASVDY